MRFGAREVRLREGDLERHEGPVIEAAVGIEGRCEAMYGEQLLGAADQGDVRTRGVPAELVGFGRKVTVIVEHRRPGRRHEGRLGFFPVRGSDKDRAGLLRQVGDEASEIGLEGLPHGAGPETRFDEGPRAPSMRDIDGGETLRYSLL